MVPPPLAGPSRDRCVRFTNGEMGHYSCVTMREVGSARILTVRLAFDLLHGELPDDVLLRGQMLTIGAHLSVSYRVMPKGSNSARRAKKTWSAWLPIT